MEPSRPPGGHLPSSFGYRQPRPLPSPPQFHPRNIRVSGSPFLQNNMRPCTKKKYTYTGERRRSDLGVRQNDVWDASFLKAIEDMLHFNDSFELGRALLLSCSTPALFNHEKQVGNSEDVRDGIALGLRLLEDPEAFIISALITVGVVSESKQLGRPIELIISRFLVGALKLYHDWFRESHETDTPILRRCFPPQLPCPSLPLSPLAVGTIATISSSRKVAAEPVSSIGDLIMFDVHGDGKHNARMAIQRGFLTSTGTTRSRSGSESSSSTTSSNTHISLLDAEAEGLSALETLKPLLSLPQPASENSRMALAPSDSFYRCTCEPTMTSIPISMKTTNADPTSTSSNRVVNDQLWRDRYQIQSRHQQMLLNEIANHKSTLQVYAALEVFDMGPLLMRLIPNPIHRRIPARTPIRASINTTTIRTSASITWGSVLVRDLLQIDRIVESVMTVSRFFNERDYSLDQELLPRLLDLRSLSLVHEFVGNFEDICIMVLERIECRLMKQLEQWVEAGYIEQQYDRCADHTARLSKNTMVLHSPSLFSPIDSQASIALPVVKSELRVSLAEIATSLLHRFDVDPKESQIALPAVTLFTQYSIIVDLLQQSLRARPNVKRQVIHQQFQTARSDEYGLHSAWKFLPAVMEMVKKDSRLQKMTIRHCVLKQNDSYRQVAVYFAQKLALKEYYEKCFQAIDKITAVGDEVPNVGTLDNGGGCMDNYSISNGNEIIANLNIQAHMKKPVPHHDSCCHFYENRLGLGSRTSNSEIHPLASRPSRELDTAFLISTDPCSPGAHRSPYKEDLDDIQACRWQSEEMQLSRALLLSSPTSPTTLFHFRN